MLEFCLAGFLNTNRKPCSEFPIICGESMLFLHIYRKKRILMSKYYLSKFVMFIVKVGSYFNLCMEHFKEWFSVFGGVN